MKKIFLIVGLILSGLIFSACGSANQIYEGGSNSNMKIQFTSAGKVIIYKLNDSIAAKEFYNQLPLNVTIENYSTNEKVFHPLKKLHTDKMNLAEPKFGTLGYFEPWNNVVLYYGPFEKYPGLYSLGDIVSGYDDIEHLSGTVTISVCED